jgi:hypothetical protein
MQSQMFNLNRWFLPYAEIGGRSLTYRMMISCVSVKVELEGGGRREVREGASGDDNG